MSYKLDKSTCRPLRILIVDDNRINLSVLSTLLKRRFSHLIDGAPVSVDSGLKAIQLLRTHIFDCIFMDIQMPFLSGLEASRRIRNAEDGILSANSDAHIVAVTTAIGDEPELAYRRTRMDGMIGKPVRHQELQQYLVPLAFQAYEAALKVPKLEIDGEEVMPPLPPASEYERVFYLPANATTPSTRPDICEASDFEGLLHSQTRASLLKFDITDSTLKPMAQNLDTTLVEEDDYESTSTRLSRCNSSSSMERMKQISSLKSPPTSPSKHSRAASMMISKQTFSKQILREVVNADFNGESSKTNKLNRSSTATLRSAPSRPQILQSYTSPAWLLSTDDNSENSKRPTLSSLLWTQDAKAHCASGDCSESSEGSTTPYLRRESETSSGSISSDCSSTVTTPACESPLSFWATDASRAFGFAKDHQRGLSNSTANQSNSNGSPHKVEESWNASSDTATAGSSPVRTIESASVKCDKYTAVPQKQNIRQFDSLQELAQNIRQLDLE